MTYTFWVLIGALIASLVWLLGAIVRFLFRGCTPQDSVAEEAEDAELRGATVEQIKAMDDHRLMMLALANLLEVECDDPPLVDELKRRAKVE